MAPPPTPPRSFFERPEPVPGAVKDTIAALRSACSEWTPVEFAAAGNAPDRVAAAIGPRSQAFGDAVQACDAASDAWSASLGLMAQGAALALLGAGCVWGLWTLSRWVYLAARSECGRSKSPVFRRDRHAVAGMRWAVASFLAAGAVVVCLGLPLLFAVLAIGCAAVGAKMVGDDVEAISREREGRLWASAESRLVRD